MLPSTSDSLSDSAAVRAVEELRAFVRDEFDVQRWEFRERMALPVAMRVEKGSCVAGMNFETIDERGRAQFRHGGNDSRLREGDQVRLSQEPTARSGRELWDEMGEQGHRAWIYREEEDRIWLVRENGFESGHFLDRKEGWLIDVDFADLESFYQDAFDRLLVTDIGRERILPLFSGQATSLLDEDEFAAASRELEESGDWQEKQIEAIAGCLAADHCYLVQGPPGTGKTRVLAETVRQLVARGERVLVTAFTHRAIHNALEAVASRVGDRERVARFTAPIHRRAETYDMYKTFAESPLPELGGGWAAAATPFSLRKRLNGVDFDAIVIDEAGQMTTALAVMAMLAGPKYLLFGDERQLGPVVVSRPRREIDHLGIFHALRASRQDGTRLDVSFRLNRILAHWPSENFYGGELRSAPPVVEARLACVPRPDTASCLLEALDPAFPLVWMPVAGEAGEVRNEAEAALAAELLRAARAGGVGIEDMAVVTPYRRQARAIRQWLERLAPKQSWGDCVIDTVERMQGQERPLIVFSLCASKEDFISNQAEFLFDPRRMNVSATRARTKLVILASENLSAFHPFDTELSEEVGLWRSLLSGAKRVDPTDSGFGKCQ